MNELTDPELIERILAGEQAALMALYARHSSAVYSLALSVLGQRHLAEEVTQAIFMKVWHQTERWQSERGRFAAWLLTVTRNAALARARQEAIQTPLVDFPRETMSRRGYHAPEPQPSWEDGQLLRSLLQELPAEQQQIIVLAYYGGMSHSELAQHLGLPLDTAKNRLRLGMEALLTLWRHACASPPAGQPLANRRSEADGE